MRAGAAQPGIGSQRHPGHSISLMDTMTVIEAFNEAFNRGDVDRVMALMTADCVFENTYPPPDGERHVGQPDVRAFWERFFADTPAPRFATEDAFAAGDR